MATERRWGRYLLLSLAVVTVLVTASSPLWGNYAARHVSWLEIQRVEVSGAFLLAPHEVLEASGVRPGQHLMEDLEGWAGSLRAHPVIADARVSRHFPHTLRMRVREERPVAYVESAGGLVPATGSGLLLPVDPSRAPVNLPVVRGTMDDSTHAAAVRRMLAAVERITGMDPVLMEGVSEIVAAAPSADAMILRHRRARLVVPLGIDAAGVAQLRATLADVGRFATARAVEDGRPMTLPVLDARFGDQIVVRPSSPGKPS